ncbi:AAA family ATPase [Streptomyces sp. P1-3]|uniref:AAA family ATPase n=1 Tax=Streptomyces sp. P1-3 TaxID=3421658 RepID=UPI003D36CFA2
MKNSTHEPPLLRAAAPPAAPTPPPSERVIRLAISGTYSSGKSTTTEAVSVATGIRRTHAMTAREILLDLVPGKQLEELSANELLMLGLRRLEERIHHEALPGSFVSDGSVIHEWIYGEARMRAGINPGANILLRAVKKAAGLPAKPFYRQYMHAYGEIAKARAKRIYDGYVHLPVEFTMRADGHRPVSEPFRKLSDDLLIETLEEMEIPYHVVGGTVRERVARIVELFDLPLVMPLDDAITIAQERVRKATEVLENDARFHSAQRAKSWRRRIAYAMRY